jgi:hypothetical protein
VVREKFHNEELHYLKPSEDIFGKTKSITYIVGDFLDYLYHQLITYNYDQ